MRQPVINDPRVSPLAAMIAAGMDFRAVAKRTGYGVAHVRKLINSKERMNALSLAGKSANSVSMSNRATPEAASLIATVIRAESEQVFYRLPACTSLPATSGEGQTLPGNAPQSPRRTPNKRKAPRLF